jgi:hypothetical protein
MTTPADDLATEEAFEAFLVGRIVPEQATSTFDGLAAFAGAVRASATQPGRPNAALAELLATGLLADQSSPSTRTAPTAGRSPRRSRVRRRRRFAMIFPALLAKFLAAGALAQAATGAGVVVVAFTGAGATGVLGDDVQHTIGAAVGVSGDAATLDDTAVQSGDTTPTAADTDPGAVGSGGATSLAVDPVADVAAVVEAWQAGPVKDETFGEWVSSMAGNQDARAVLEEKTGHNFGYWVRTAAHNKGMTDVDLQSQLDDQDLVLEAPTGDTTDADPEVGIGEQAGADQPVTSTPSGKAAGQSNGNGGSGSNGNGNGNGDGKGHGGRGKG